MNKLNYPYSSYALSADGLTLKEWIGSENNIDFTIDNKLSEIQYINEFAFNNCKKLISIQLPAKLTSIEVGTFCLCLNLKTVIFPDNLLKIGEGAFANCESLESIPLPDSIEFIDEYAFSGCINLMSVTIPERVITIEKATFKDCVNLKSVTLQEGITTIKNQAFWECSSLEEVLIPYSLKSIEDFAFIGCKSLLNLIRPDKVTFVEDLGLKIDYVHTYIGTVKSNRAEWVYMWDELARDPINSICADPTVCLNDSEVWQYMGTHYDGEISHNFRHRCHPATNGRCNIEIKPSETYLAQIEENRK